ncbi:autophagy protein 5 [Candida albicans L26]|nr:autophagy protein 5 [Candida albicans P37037]KGT72408.1 autophagy protein 5 [Candida albicans 12C]KGU18471.1 autophagy protein 5 [Candida albicans L26]KGU19579.1 autophagy protein 5 [Candida albicans 19F]KHC83001.1 autophagy protein 5 [Candida albicans SC5314]
MNDIDNLAEIKKKLWNGSINVKILLNIEDQIIEYLLTIPRNSYFPTVFPQLIRYFQNFITTIELSKVPIWLEFEEVPLKWNLPVGVLYDYLYLPALLNDHDLGCWTISMKYEPVYPIEYIISFNEKLAGDGQIDYMKTMNRILMNQLKQSCFVLNGTAKPIMQLSEANTNQLWKSLISRNLGDFNVLNKKIIKTIDRIPVKIYIAGSPIVVQAPISKDQTLQEILSLHTPNLSSSSSSMSHPYIQGIDVTSLMNQSIREIWQLFKHLDNFLYITLIIL